VAGVIDFYCDSRLERSDQQFFNVVLPLSPVLVIYPQIPFNHPVLTPPRLTLSKERRTMGWQTTFTLSRRAKGCHLVTNEVVSHIRDGLKDVKVLYSAFLFAIPCIDL